VFGSVRFVGKREKGGKKSQRYRKKNGEKQSAGHHRLLGVKEDSALGGGKKVGRKEKGKTRSLKRKKEGNLQFLLKKKPKIDEGRGDEDSPLSFFAQREHRFYRR